MHIVQRGNDRQNSFRHDNDYAVYLVHLRELAQRHDCFVHAYCLMTNHVHLLVTPKEGRACTSLMRDLGQRYVQYFNRRHGRTGTLWEGRFRSCLVESAFYVLACYRYIELNPVRAGICARPGDYRWSSHLANAGTRPDPRLSAHPEYIALGATTETRHRSYLGLFQHALEPALVDSIRESTNAGYPLGTERFKAHLAQAHGCKLEPGKAGRPRKSGSDPDFWVNAGGVS